MRRLLGWLFFTVQLLDSDLDKILQEHEQVGRPLRPHFEEMYLRGLERLEMEAGSDAPRS